MNATWKAAIGVILIFILGWFGGALSTIILARQKVAAMVREPERMASVIERQTTHGMKLTDDQKIQLHALLVENIRQRLQLQRQIQPQVRAFNRETMEKIDALLTPTEQQKFLTNLLLIKTRSGANPLNTGPDEKPVPAPASSDTNGAVGTAPAQ